MPLPYLKTFIAIDETSRCRSCKSQTSGNTDGDSFKPTYLRIINNQLNVIFNHAERYYNLEKNPVHKVDKMGSKEAGEM